jgi:hypothetical protein
MRQVKKSRMTEMNPNCFAGSPLQISAGAGHIVKNSLDIKKDLAEIYDITSGGRLLSPHYATQISSPSSISRWNIRSIRKPTPKPQTKEMAQMTKQNLLR